MTHYAEFAALRLWGVVIGCFPIELNLATARLMGRIWWRLRADHRDRALGNLRAALGSTHTERQLEQIAIRSSEHFAQVYLVELVQAAKLVNLWSWSRYVELDRLGDALRVLLDERRGAILLTAHFGNFELLGYTLARLGLPLTAVMRPLDNALLNDYLIAARNPGGLTLLIKKGAASKADDVLRRHDSLCFIADQDAGRKGVFATFFGRAASWYKSIGLLAMSHRVPIIVGAAMRTRVGFHYRIAVERIIEPYEWDAQPDPLLWITQAYANALEALIRRHPEQYLWVHRRWKTRPKGGDTPADAAHGGD